VYRVEVLRDKLLNKLIDAGWLTEANCWRRDLIEAALSYVIAEWAAKVNQRSQARAVASAVARLSKIRHVASTVASTEARA
jgi:hypothetical protein